MYNFINNIFQGESMPISKALLIADPDVYRNAEVIDLMHRAGFEVHLLSSSRYPKSYPNLHKFIYVSKPELIPKVAINIFLD